MHLLKVWRVELAEMFNAAPSGQKVQLKDAYRATLKQAESFIDSIAEALVAAVEGEDGFYRRL